MKAIILAAGRGSRMGHITNEKPKCLTVVNNSTLISQQISALTAAGITEICVVTGYKAECLKKYGTYQVYNPNWAETNMVASLLCAKEWLDQSDCIISYSDIFYSSRIIKNLIDCEHEIVISYDPNWLKIWSNRFANPLDDAETFRVDNDGYLLEIGRKPHSIDEIQGQYMGLLKFKKGCWEFIIKQNKDINYSKIDMTSCLAVLLEFKYKIKCVPNFDAWGEIDQLSDLKAMEDIA